MDSLASSVASLLPCDWLSLCKSAVPGEAGSLGETCLALNGEEWACEVVIYGPMCATPLCVNVLKKKFVEAESALADMSVEVTVVSQ